MAESAMSGSITKETAKMGKMINKKTILAFALGFILIFSIGIIGADVGKELKIEKAVVETIDNEGKARVIVVMKDSAKLSKKTRIMRESAINEIGKEKVKHKFEGLNAFSAYLDEKDIEKLANNDNIEKIYYDMPVKVFLQDSVPLINASKSWTLQTNGMNLTGKGQTVCIIDTGVDYTHPDLGNCTPVRHLLNGTTEDYILQSAHPYANNFDYIWTITKEGYEKIAVHFANISLEYPGQVGYDSFDRIIIYNSEMEEIARYHGVNGVITDLWTPYSDGGTIYVRLVTDESITAYGFYIDKVINGTTNTTYDWSNCSKVIGGWDFYNNEGDPKDDNGHGTHVAGIVAANGTIRGVAPEAKIVVAKSMSSSGDGYGSDLIAGIEFCVNRSRDYNISVISMSLGYPGYYNSTYCDADDPLTAAAINSAVAKNISVVIASGNDGETNAILGPACIKNATRVGSTTKSDLISSFSNRWALDMLVAPGSGINSTKINGGYISMDGTSMATPHVAGAIAIINQYLASVGRSKTPQEIGNALNATGKIIYDSGSGRNYSRINLYNAVISFDIDKPSVSLISPVDNYKGIESLNITFRCNASDLSLKNATFYLWNLSSVYNQSFSEFSGAEGLFEVNVTNITQGDYLWNCEFYDSNGNGALASSNYSLTIATANAPVINITSPINNSWYNSGRFNISINKKGVCIYSLDNGKTNASMNSNDNKTFSAVNNNLDEGNYNVTFYCNNSYGNLSYEIVFFNVEKTAPNVTLVFPDDGYSATGAQTINFQYNVSDELNITQCALIINNAIDSYNSSEINVFGTNNISKFVSAGAYTWNINCTDEAGNIGNGTARSLTINSGETPKSSGGGGGGGGGAATATYEPSSEQMASGYTKALKKGDKIKFENHSLTANYIGNNFVNLSIMSNPINILLFIGEEKKINLSSIKYYDLYLKLNGIANNAANLTIKTIYEEIAKEEEKEAEEKTVTNVAIANEKIEEKMTIRAYNFKVILVVIGGIIIFIIIYHYREYVEEYLMKRRVRKKE